MIGMIMGLTKSFRFWAILGALGALASLAVWGYNQVYDAGYQAAELKYQKNQLAAIESAITKARAEWELSASAAEIEIRIEEEIAERIRAIEREIPKTVERVVSPECRDLGPDIQRVFNSAIGSSDSDEGSSTPTPPYTPE